MRVVAQRVSRGVVSVEGEEVGRISSGLLLLLGFRQDDTPSIVEYMGEKIVKMRIFPDDNDKMNLSALDLRRGILAVPQFTLYADCRKGNRPGFSGAGSPKKAEELFHLFVETLKRKGLPVETGVFGAYMEVSLTNDGPVTILLDSDDFKEKGGH